MAKFETDAIARMYANATDVIAVIDKAKTSSQSEQEYKDKIYERVKEYFKSKEFSAETFEMFSLQGTPSTILVDRKGILRDVSFGQNANLESMVKTLIGE